eukprot:Polyplicarium_translucidae@DN2770_c0_g1_i2.p1
MSYRLALRILRHACKGRWTLPSTTFFTCLGSRFENVLKRCVEKRLFVQLGYEISADGIRADSRRVAALLTASSPTSAKVCSRLCYAYGFFHRNASEDRALRLDRRK